MVEDTFLPHCLSMGIRVEEFWNMNIRSLHPFLKAEEIKLQRRNAEMHLQGAYIYDAVSVALANAFRRSGDKVARYPDKPYDLSTSKEEREERKHQAEIERLKAAFGAFAEQTQKRLEHGN